MNRSSLIFLIFIFHFSFFTFHFVVAQDTTKLRDGYHKFYYPSGVMSSEGTMKDGKPDAYWKAYYENGKLKSEGNRKKFEIDSTWKFYNEEGKLILEVNYRNGKKNGMKTTFLDKETVKENFINDIKEGYARHYFPDGMLKMEIPFVKGLEQGLAKEYAPDGSIITLIEYKKGFVVERIKINRKDQNNLKQGRWYVFYQNGNVKQEGNYQDDKKNGYFKEFTESGDLISVNKYINDVLQEEAEEIAKLDVQNEYYPDGKIKVRATYRNGLPEGVRRDYTPEGEIEKSSIYKNGVMIGEGIVKEDGAREGHWKEYYPDGSLKAEGDYKDDKPVGEWKYFYQDGKLEQKGKYSAAGKLTGIWKRFFNSGQLMLEEQYLNGEKDGLHTEYDESGRIIDQGEYIKGEEDGPWFTTSGDYFERGNYRDGLRSGKWTTWFFSSKDAKIDSILRFSGSFIDDNPQGKHTYYWENGKVKDEGIYVGGRKDGDWYKFNEDGTLFLIITYKNGVEIKYDGVKIKPPVETGDE